MGKVFATYVTVVLAAVMLAGCSAYSKLIKSQDREKMYLAGMKYFENKKYQRVQQLFEEIDPYYQGTQREDTIKFHLASSFYNQGDFETSGMLLEQYRRGVGRTSPFLEQAEYMYAMGFYYSSPSPQRDQGNTMRAMMAINEYLERYPESVKKEQLQACVEELQGKLYDKEYLNSKLYYSIGRYKSAVVALQNALNDSPLNPHREEMMYLVARSGYLLASNSVVELQRERYLRMMDYCLNFSSEFPDSKYARELDRLMQQAKDHLASEETPEENTENNTADNGTKKE
jgi:outer membrane protein assembly factor BamD